MINERKSLGDFRLGLAVSTRGDAVNTTNIEQYVGDGGYRTATYRTGYPAKGCAHPFSIIVPNLETIATKYGLEFVQGPSDVLLTGNFGKGMPVVIATNGAFAVLKSTYSLQGETQIPSPYPGLFTDLLNLYDAGKYEE